MKPKLKAFGAPGIEPRWTSSAKQGLGTAYSSNCRLWFTISHGIVNEIYYPFVDRPNTRDFQFLISDGESFCHEEKRDLDHQIEYLEHDCLLYCLTNSEPNGRYRLVKHILADPHRSVLVVHTKLEIFDESLRGKLKLYALLAPHIARYGTGNSGWCTEFGAAQVLLADRAGVHLVMGCNTGFRRRSIGYVGSSDGWQDVMRHLRMEWEFSEAEDGNIALTGEIDLPESNKFTIAIALSLSCQSAAVQLLQSLAEPFSQHRESYVRQWRRTTVNPNYDFSEHTSDGGGTYRLSRCVLLAHEDKLFEGAMVASMSIPWGETKGDDDLGGYHLVWTRDLVVSATALLASGQIGTPERALIWLSAIQNDDGSFPQNSWIDGTAYWTGLQLDEIAAPILLAWRLSREPREDCRFDAWPMIARATAYLIQQGPVTGQDRWEENAGYSPSTLAFVIGGLVCAAEFAKRREETAAAEFILAYADWLNSHIEDWTATTQGELVEGLPHHYIRINTTDPGHPDPHADPDKTEICIANGGGLHPVKNIVGGDFLHLVRLGMRNAKDPLVLRSIEVMDRILERTLPQGRCWRRYNFDGYGQKADSSAFDGTGVGRSWPLLTGERGHYELAAGRDPAPFIKAMEDFANDGGMLSEQLWDEDDLPNTCMKRGKPTGAAMPLCWAHAEYISLVRSRRDGVCFDRIEPAYQRYVQNPVQSYHEMWSFRHQLRQLQRGKTLRLIIAAHAQIVWTSDGWANMFQTGATKAHPLNLWFVDIPTDNPGTMAIEFTFFWTETQSWEGKNFKVEPKNI